MVFDENVFDEIDHFHPNFDESVPNLFSSRGFRKGSATTQCDAHVHVGEHGCVRGIATNTSCRRLVSKNLAWTCSPFQFALSTRAGTRCVVHAIRDAEGRTTTSIGAQCCRNSWKCRESNTEPIRQDDEGHRHDMEQHEGVKEELESGKMLFAFLDDTYVLSRGDRTRPIFNLLAVKVHLQASIRLHASKTRTWNMSEARPPDVDDLGPGVWHGEGGGKGAHQGVGHASWFRSLVQSHTDGRLEEEHKLWEAVGWVPDAQCAWQILVQCARPRCHHLIKTMFPASQQCILQITTLECSARSKRQHPDYIVSPFYPLDFDSVALRVMEVGPIACLACCFILNELHELSDALEVQFGPVLLLFIKSLSRKYAARMSTNEDNIRRKTRTLCNTKRTVASFLLSSTQTSHNMDFIFLHFTEEAKLEPFLAHLPTMLFGDQNFPANQCIVDDWRFLCSKIVCNLATAINKSVSACNPSGIIDSHLNGHTMSCFTNVKLNTNNMETEGAADSMADFIITIVSDE